MVLPCYNAAEWIDEFIGGLLAHDKVNWRLITRDDGSEDGTLALLKGWQEARPAHAVARSGRSAKPRADREL